MTLIRTFFYFIIFYVGMEIIKNPNNIIYLFDEVIIHRVTNLDKF